MKQLEPIHSLLFLPATRIDRLDKALASGASWACVDLEDAVEPAAKAAGRAAVLAMLDERADLARIAVRINAPQDENGLRDLLALIEAPRLPGAVMIPKAESAEEVRWVRKLLGARRACPPLVPVIETARGIDSAPQIVAAVPEVVAVMLGGVDLCADLGAELEWSSLVHARGAIVSAAAMAGAGSIDAVFIDLQDHTGLRDECLRARRMGFTGKALIHPGQVAAAIAAFTPTEAEVERARRVVDAYERSGGGVTLLDGRLVELPVLRSAQRTLAMAASMKSDRSPGVG